MWFANILSDTLRGLLRGEEVREVERFKDAVLLALKMKCPEAKGCGCVLGVLSIMLGVSGF